MLEIITATAGVTWHELDEVWPWSRVIRAHETVTRNRYYAAYPIAALQATYIAAHLPKGRRGPKPHELMLPGAIPAALRTPATQAVYSPAVVRAFTLARHLGFTSNAHLNAFGTNELRASGWGRTEERRV